MRNASIGLFIVGGLLLLAATAPQARAASRESFTATITFGPLGTPEKFWIDDQGVAHYRGVPSTGTITGDIVGTVSSLSNANFDAAGNGDTSSFFTISPASGGTWTGHANSTLVAGVASGKLVAQGSGALDGTKIMGSTMFLLFVDEPEIVQGIILSPHG